MNSSPTKKCIFVYNAKSGKWNAYLDSVHKLLSPSTYACKLCALTYGLWSENEKWKAFRQNSSVEMEFLHTDEWEKSYPEWAKTFNDFPFVLKVNQQNQPEMYLDAQAFRKLDKVEDLMEKINLLE